MTRVPGGLGGHVHQHPAHLPVGQVGRKPRGCRHRNESVERDLAGLDVVEQRLEAGNPAIEGGQQLLAGEAFDRVCVALGDARAVLGGGALADRLDAEAVLLRHQPDVIDQGGQGEVAHGRAPMKLLVAEPENGAAHLGELVEHEVACNGGFAGGIGSEKGHRRLLGRRVLLADMPSLDHE